MSAPLNPPSGGTSGENWRRKFAEKIAADAALAEKVSGEAYQIIGALASEADLFEHPAVIRALDYFGYEQWRKPGAEILPWHVDAEPPSPST